MAENTEAEIAINPPVMVGKPVVAGIRTTVEHIVREMANGATITDLHDMRTHHARTGDCRTGVRSG